MSSPLLVKVSLDLWLSAWAGGSEEESSQNQELFFSSHWSYSPGPAHPHPLFFSSSESETVKV